MPPTPVVLKMKRVTRVDLVDRGADPNAHVVIYKRDEPVAKTVTREGDAWVVRSTDGKLLGKHGTEADANAQLAAVEANKAKDAPAKKSLVQKVLALFKAAGVDPADVGDGTCGQDVEGEPCALEAGHDGECDANPDDAAIGKAVDGLIAASTARVAKVGRKISTARLDKLKALRGVIAEIIAEQEAADTSEVGKRDLEALPQRVRNAFYAQFSPSGVNLPAGMGMWPTEVDDDVVIAEVNNPIAGGPRYRRVPWSDAAGQIVFDVTQAQDVERTWTPVVKGAADPNHTHEESEMKIAVSTLTEGAQYVLKGLNLGAEVEDGQAAWATGFAKAFKMVDGKPVFDDSAKDGKKEPDEDDKPVAKAVLAELSEPVRKLLGDWKITQPTTGEVKFAKRVAGEVDEDVFRGMSAQQRQLYLVQKRENDELRAKVTKAEGDRERERYIKKAASFTHLPIKADDDHVIFKAVDAVVEKVGEKTVGERLDEILKAANEAIKVGKVYGEIGTTAGDPNAGQSAWGQIQSKAAELVSKDASMTKEAAVAKFLETAEGKQLYAQHEREQSGARERG